MGSAWHSNHKEPTLRILGTSSVGRWRFIRHALSFWEVDGCFDNDDKFIFAAFRVVLLKVALCTRLPIPPFPSTAVSWPLSFICNWWLPFNRRKRIKQRAIARRGALLPTNPHQRPAQGYRWRSRRWCALSPRKIPRKCCAGTRR